MVVLTDITTPADGFELGRVTADLTGLRIELDRVVPLNEDLLPYLWVHGDGDRDRFERALSEVAMINDCQQLEQVGTRSLYRLQWCPRGDGLLSYLIDNDATILEGHGQDPWFFRLRFPTRDALTTCYEACQDAGVGVEVQRVYGLQDAFEEDQPGELTEGQFEILSLALREGYYEVPRDVTLGELAQVLGISKQAASERLRRGMRTALEQVL